MKSPTICCIALLCAALNVKADSCGWPADETTALTPTSKASTPSLTGLRKHHSASLTGWATWYSRASARREGTGGKQILMANGRPLNDLAMTCAAWNTKFGQRVRVTNLVNGRTVLVTVTDRGPGRSSRRRGVIIDLSQAAMLALAGQDGIKRGRIAVKVSKL